MQRRRLHPTGNDAAEPTHDDGDTFSHNDASRQTDNDTKTLTDNDANTLTDNDTGKQTLKNADLPTDNDADLPTDIDADGPIRSGAGLPTDAGKPTGNGAVGSSIEERTVFRYFLNYVSLVHGELQLLNGFFDSKVGKRRTPDDGKEEVAGKMRGGGRGDTQTVSSLFLPLYSVPCLTNISCCD